MENKVENFKRIAGNRTNKIIDMVESLVNLSNNSYYEYTNEDIEKIFNSINAELNKSKKILLDANNNKKKRFTL